MARLPQGLSERFPQGPTERALHVATIAPTARECGTKERPEPRRIEMHRLHLRVPYRAELRRQPGQEIGVLAGAQRLVEGPEFLQHPALERDAVAQRHFLGQE